MAGARFAESNRSAAIRVRIHPKSFGEAARSGQTDSHSGSGGEGSFQDGIQIGNAASLVVNVNGEKLRARIEIQLEVDLAAARVLVRISGNFRNRGGERHLILWRKAQHAGQMPGPLARRHDVLLGGEFQRE